MNTKVIFKEGKDNSKNRRYKQRGELMAKRKAEAKEAAEKELEKRKEDAGIGGASDSVAKAILSPQVTKDTLPALEKSDDAMYHKVNHAHQRNPKKKWS
ncbi:hypothetical protein [Klebsiella sp. P1CD1]|uniref:hypothetical protein n=1 Tax=Klebsiella sp. P1CD1 TaxID=2267618 RepID=UPI001D0DA108|nr:hypothetical protein [Klebsiella sp. P1CD1]